MRQEGRQPDKLADWFDGATHARGILYTAGQAGLDSAALQAAAGVPQAVVEAQLISSVPYRYVAALMAEAVARSGDDAFGLWVGRDHSAPLFGGVCGYFLINLPSFEAILRESYDMLHRISNVVRTELIVEGGQARFMVMPQEPALPQLEHLVDFHMAVFTGNTRRFVKEDFSPLEVRLQRAPPTRRDAHERYFGCPVRFGDVVNEMRFAADWLALSPPGADPQLLAVLRPYVDELKAAAPLGGSVTERVRTAVMMQLRQESVALPAVARAVGMAPRTLQHHLRAEGTTFQAVLDGLRRRLARDLLATPSVSIEEVGYRLGFSGPTAFSRAFRRWTGRTPWQYRAEQTRQH